MSPSPPPLPPSPPFSSSSSPSPSRLHSIKLTGTPSNHLTPTRLRHSSTSLSPQVLAASGLVKRDLFSLPNPFAVITTDGSDLRQTTVFKRTLTPYWNETFELFRAFSPFLLCHPLILP